MGASIAMDITGDSYFPDETTLGVIRKVTEGLGSVPGISVRLYAYPDQKWRFLISFAWRGNRFAVIVYGYGHGGEIVFGDDTMCRCGDLPIRGTMLKFEPEPLRQKLTELLLKEVEKEKARLKEICEKLGQKPQGSRIAHSGGGASN